jgi:hypothetical protein
MIISDIGMLYESIFPWIKYNLTIGILLSLFLGIIMEEEKKRAN